MLFDINHEENDRLILAEEDRRRQLIESAVKSFAPHLEGKDGLRVIHLWSTNDSLRKEVRDAFGGGKTIVVEHCLNKRGQGKGHQIKHDGMVIDIPKKADMVVTKTDLNKRIELFAAQLDALPVVLPEGIPYIHERLKKTDLLVMVGGEQRKP